MENVKTQETQKNTGNINLIKILAAGDIAEKQAKKEDKPQITTDKNALYMTTTECAINVSPIIAKAKGDALYNKLRTQINNVRRRTDTKIVKIDTQLLTNTIQKIDEEAARTLLALFYMDTDTDGYFTLTNKNMQTIQTITHRSFENLNGRILKLLNNGFLEMNPTGEKIKIKTDNRNDEPARTLDAPTPEETGNKEPEENLTAGEVLNNGGKTIAPRPPETDGMTM